jgi:prepilin-type N-terminal cleavage/methylation domain-containing protein
MFKKFLANQRGFTLVEIMTTLTIIVVILSVSASGMNRLNSRSNLKLVSSVLVSDLRNTAMSALNAQQYQLQATNNWGIRLESLVTPTYYVIFADLDNDKTYDLNEKVKTVTLSKNIKLGCINFNSACDAYGDIVFNNETGIPYFNTIPVTSATDNVEITLYDDVTSETEYISVNTLGVITLGIISNE